MQVGEIYNVCIAGVIALVLLREDLLVTIAFYHHNFVGSPKSWVTLLWGYFYQVFILGYWYG